MKRILVLSAVCALWFALPAQAADTLPSRYTDAEFWRMVTDFSESGGAFPYENFVSNEVSYQDILPAAPQHDAIAVERSRRVLTVLTGQPCRSL